MNEDLIKKLYDKSIVLRQGGAGESEDPADLIRWFDYRKFAQLIVEECIKSISPAEELPKKFDMETLDIFIINAVRTECVAEIKKHFGVKG